MDDIARLADLLGSTDGAEDEQTLTLLALHGRKAVEALLTAASSTEPRRRAASIAALGRIGDPRGRRTLTLALADRNPIVRSAAVTALSAFPSEETASRVRGMLEREDDPEIRLRAASTLVDMFNSGTVEALDPLLGLAQDTREDRRVRLEALKVLSMLPPREARSIASGLMEDKDARLAQAAGRFAGPPSAEADGGAAEALAELGSSDYFTYRRAASLLASMGEPAIPVLVRALRDRAGDAAGCARVASVLREIARGRERAVARHLDEIEEIVPLGLMVDIIGESRDRTALYHLKGVIDRLEGQQIEPPVQAGFGLPVVEGRTETEGRLAREMIVAKAHYYLARAGSRVAFDSLKAALGRRSSRLPGEILMAVEEIGGREELLDLMSHYGREDSWMRGRIRESFRRLMRKARVGPDDPIFQKLAEPQRALLAEILTSSEPRGAPPAGPAPSRRRAGRVDTV